MEIRLVALSLSLQLAHRPSLYRWSPFGALMYIHPSDPLHEAQSRSATVCVPVLRVVSRSPNPLWGTSAHRSFRSSIFPSDVLIVEFIRLFSFFISMQQVNDSL